MPIIYDGLRTITISFLKTHKYLEPGSFKGGSINWSQNGLPTGNIDIIVSTVEESSYMELIYMADGTPINYRVKLVSVPSNLGFGLIRYFLCPVTGKRCRKLYLIGNYFSHRSACDGLYEKQTKSKSGRELYKFFSFLDTDQHYEKLHRKHLKKTYAGKPTRKYIQISNKIKKAENLPPALFRQFLAL